MIRIRKNDEGYEVTIRYINTCVIEGLDVCISDIKSDICDDLNKLVVNADSFDEVKIDNDGNLHCKNLAPVVDEPESEDTDE